jgi:hypothetical protein
MTTATVSYTTLSNDPAMISAVKRQYRGSEGVIEGEASKRICSRDKHIVTEIEGQHLIAGCKWCFDVLRSPASIQWAISYTRKWRRVTEMLLLQDLGNIRPDGVALEYTPVD